MNRWLALTPVLAAVAAAPAGAARAPSLTIVRTAPLVVQGTAFRPREWVTVTGPAGHMRVRTTAKGAFVATFSVVTDRCTGGRVVALSVNGERVTLVMPRTLCAPAAGA